jgi:hypothetical protein
MKTRNDLLLVRSVAISLLVLAAASSSLAMPRLSLSTVRGFPGATVEVPLTLRYATNDLLNVVGLQADVVIESGNAASDSPRAGDALRGHLVPSSQPSAKVRRILVYASNNAAITNGTVVTLPFVVPAGSFQNVRLTLTNVILATASALAVPATTVSGGIAIQPVYVRTDGDVDGFFFVPPNHEYVVQATTNFNQWINLTTNGVVDSLLQFIDLDAHRYPYRFYRAMPLGGLVDANVRLESGRVSFAITGVAGRSYVLQASPDLVEWVSLSTNILSGTTIRLTNQLDLAYPQRFFRLKSGL